MYKTNNQQRYIVQLQELQILFCNNFKWGIWDFPGTPVVKTSSSIAGGVGLIPGWGAKIPHASWPKTKKYKTEAIL